MSVNFTFESMGKIYVVAVEIKPLLKHLYLSANGNLESSGIRLYGSGTGFSFHSTPVIGDTLETAV